MRIISNDIEDSINKTRGGFEESFQAENFYNNQTQYEKHLKLILDFLEVRPGRKILDLGTGTGYQPLCIASLSDVLLRILHQMKMMQNGLWMHTCR